MVKSKKMSKTSIAVIVLALLLVLSLVMGITGAWFTDNGQTSNERVNLKFGTVDYELAMNTVVSKEGKKVQDVASGENEAGEATYYLIAGTEIVTSINLTNNSNVTTAYVIVNNEHYYYLNEAGKLTELNPNTEGNNLANMKLTERQSKHFQVRYTVVETADHGALANAIFTYAVYDGSSYGEEQTLSGSEFAMNAVHVIVAADLEENGAYYAQRDTLEVGDEVLVTPAHTTLVFGDKIDLGTRLITGTYEFRAVQLNNLTEANTEAANLAAAYTKLTTGWSTINTVSNDD